MVYNCKRRDGSLAKPGMMSLDPSLSGSITLSLLCVCVCLFFYDRDCETRGYEGCFTDDIPECRTCYLSETIYMAATGATELNMPGWSQCPCCVPTTLEDSHTDIEVRVCKAGSLTCSSRRRVPSVT